MHLLFSAINKNADENKMPFTTENETKMDIRLLPKNETENESCLLPSESSFPQSMHCAFLASVSPFLKLFRAGLHDIVELVTLKNSKNHSLCSL